MRRGVIASALAVALGVGLASSAYVELDNRREADAKAYAASLAASETALTASENALAVATAPRFFATVKASKDAEFVAAAKAGVEYWEGRDGKTPATSIVRDNANPCSEGAIGCTWTVVDPKSRKATCHIYVDASLNGNRWALFAVAAHEVGHCMGHGHIEGDLVMSP